MDLGSHPPPFPSLKLASRRAEREDIDISNHVTIVCIRKAISYELVYVHLVTNLKMHAQDLRAFSSSFSPSCIEYN